MEGVYVNVYKDKSFMHVNKRCMHQCIKLKQDKKNFVSYLSQSERGQITDSYLRSFTFHTSYPYA